MIRAKRLSVVKPLSSGSRSTAGDAADFRWGPRSTTPDAETTGLSA